jgi:hypothetical protein
VVPYHHFQPHRADQRLILCEPQQRRIQVRAAETGKDRRTEDLDGDRLPNPQRERRVVHQQREAVPEAEVLLGRQGGRRPAEEIERQTGTAQQILYRHPEIAEQRLPAEIDDEPVVCCAHAI